MGLYSELNNWSRNKMLSVPLLMNASFFEKSDAFSTELFKEIENYWKSLYDDNIVFEITSWMQSDGTNEKNENSSAYESSEALIRQVHYFQIGENYIKPRREEILLEMKNEINFQEDRRDIMSLFLLKYSEMKIKLTLLEKWHSIIVPRKILMM
ncbi:14516_t:CDS:2 [Funneliformis mosseae]|uniref:14516_t:CDS:1 n=1 Tax=Funneliformis mosseae TaxID=27381 RepID=A0A9N8WQL9_FUNMO|nr:14516_t:CDS:2 [Funneliformis mosseae]